MTRPRPPRRSSRTSPRPARSPAPGRPLAIGAATAGQRSGAVVPDGRGQGRQEKTVVNAESVGQRPTAAWTEWRIPLSDLTGVNLTAVQEAHARRRRPDQPEGGRRRHAVLRRHRVRPSGQVAQARNHAAHAAHDDTKAGRWSTGQRPALCRTVTLSDGFGKVRTRYRLCHPEAKPKDLGHRIGDFSRSRPRSFAADSG